MRMTRKMRRMKERKRQNLEKVNSVLTNLKKLAATTAILATLSSGEVLAMPQDGTVVAGSATITQNASSMAINQVTDKVAINWQSFNIGANEKVAFNQPTAQSVALNRIIGNNASDIYGQLTANGKVFLVNPNGILFAPGSEVNVGGLVASTLGISDADFLRGNYSFKGDNGIGTIVNKGTLTAKDGNYIVLVGTKVNNSGNIIANGGTAALAAGGQVLLDSPGDGMVNLVVSQAAVDAAVNNSGNIQANGGQALLTGRASGDLLSSVINNTGMVSAKSVHEQNGVIILDGGISGSVQVSGVLNASGQEAGQSGGTVKILGDKISLLGGAEVDASGTAGGGQILVGGNLQGSGAEQHAVSVSMDKSAVLKADATSQGDGGKVILWSDEDTRFHGTISAKGGNNGGNGGLVETSGKQYLAADGNVTVAAPKGQGGTWLLDPRNVTIQATGQNVIGGIDYVPVTDSAIVDVNSINTALSGGSNVHITTGTTGTQDGNITVASNITKTGTGDATLTLSAANNIIVKANTGITASDGKLNVNFDADADNQYGGAIQMQSGSSITTNGGNIAMYGQGDNVAGYARSITTAMDGIQLLGATLNSGSGNITLRGQNTATIDGTAKGVGISLANTGNQLISNGGTITIVGDAGDKGISISDTASQLSAGSGDIILTADKMDLAGKIGKTGDTGTLLIQPLHQSTSIGIGDGATGTLQLSSAVFTSVIQSALSKVTIGSANSSGIINVGTVNFGNNVMLQAPGISTSPDSSGKITITGQLTSGKSITLNSVQGTSTDQKIIADGLELLGAGASYNFTNTANKVNTLAANTGSLIYNGAAATSGGTVTIGTVGTTNGITLTQPGAITVTDGSLTVASAVNDGGDLQLKAAKDIVVETGVSITASGSKNVTITSGASNGVNLKDGASISAGGGAIAITGGTTTLGTSSSIHSNGGAVTVTNTGAVQLNGTSIDSGNGAITLEGSSITATGTNSVAAGSGTVTFTADKMTFPAIGNIVSGSGTVNIRPLTLGKIVDIGDNVPNTAATHLQLPSNLFTSTGAFGSSNFSALNIGRLNDGTGAVHIGSGLTFYSPTIITSGVINITGTADVDNTSTNKSLSLIAGSITSASGAKIKSGSGLLTFSADSMNFNSYSSISTGNGGQLLLKPKTDGVTVGLGSGTGTLQLSDMFFDKVFQPGFSDITVEGAATSGLITVNGLTSVKHNLTLLSSGNIILAGNLQAASGKTITLKASTGASQTAGTIIADGLQLLGAGAQYKLDANYNQVGKLSADTGSVTFKGSGVTVDTVTNAAHGTVAGITTTGNVLLESDAGTILTQNSSITSTDGGNITLTADRMAFNGGSIASSGKLRLQPLDPTRPIDIGTYTPNANHLQLAGSLFNSGVQPGFDSITIGHDNGSGQITAAGAFSFSSPTIIQAPTTAGTIQLEASADITTTDGKDITLTAGTLSSDAGAKVRSSGDVHLTADVMKLGNGTDPGSTITGPGTLYLKPLINSRTIDLGTGLTETLNHLQFNDNMFNGANKVFSGFNTYTIGSGVTQNVTVKNAANFTGNLNIKAPNLHLFAESQLKPTGNVGLWNDKMIFEDHAKVTGEGNLTLAPYTSGNSMVVGDIAGADPAALTIANGAFTGEGRTDTDAVFTGNYTGTLTFGDVDIANKIKLDNVTLSAGLPSSSFANLSNLAVLAQGGGTAEIDGSTLAINRDITIKAGTIATGAGTTITTGSGDITLAGETINLNSGTNSIRGTHELNLQSYNAGDNIAVGDVDSLITGGFNPKLRLYSNLFYNDSAASPSSGALGNTFNHITIGQSDGYGAIQIKDAAFQNSLTVLSPLNGGSITLKGNLSNPGKTITLHTAGGITQTAGTVTAGSLELLGGNTALAGNNDVGILAARVSALTFHNSKALSIGTVNTTGGVTTAGLADISSGAGLTVSNNVTSNAGGAISLSGDSLTISSGVKIMAGAGGDITLTGDTMSIAADADVTGQNKLNIQTLDAAKSIGIGGSGANSLELSGSLFSPDTQVFKDGFSMITIGKANGTGTVTIDNPVTFSDAVTIQSPGGKVVMGATGSINNASTNQAVTLKGATIMTNAGSVLNGGSGTVTLQGNTMDFTNGGTITGSGNLVVKALADSTGITLGKTINGNEQTIHAGDLVLDAAAFNGDVNTVDTKVIKNGFDNIIVGQASQSGPITVNDFKVGTDLQLLNQAAGGTVTVNGTLDTTNKDLTIKAYGNIDGSAGKLSSIGVLNASSAKGGINFSPSTGQSVNTIGQLGKLTAWNGITVRNNAALALNDQIVGNQSGAAGTANSVLIRSNGDLTIKGGATVKAMGGADIYLAAEGAGSQFFNDSLQTSKALSVDSGRWLIYSYSPLPSGSDNASNRTGGLSSDFRRYNVTYDNTPPGSANVPANKNGFLYEYQPILDIETASRTYGDDNTTISFNYKGLLAGDTIGDLLLTGTPNIDIGEQIINAASAAGTENYYNHTPYTLNFTQNTASTANPNSLISLMGYLIQSKSNIPLTINKRSLTITPTDVTKVYDGKTSPSPTYSYTGGLVTGDALSDVILKGDYTTNPNAGLYPIYVDSWTITGNPGDNYKVTAPNGMYTITKAPLTVTVANQTKIYGNNYYDAQAYPAFTVTGFVNGEDKNALGYKDPTVSTVGQFAPVNTNGYVLTASGGTAANYSFNYVDGKLTIKPRPITVTADSNQSKTYGQSDPTFTYQVGGQGLVNNDKLTGVLGRDSTSQNVGSSYKIVQNTITNENNPNYEITYEPAFFTINRANLTITADPKTHIYGDDNPALTATFTGLTNGDTKASISPETQLVLSTGADKSSSVGDYAITASGNSLLANYTVSYVGNKLTITKAPLTVTVNSYTKTYGDINPIPEFIVSGFKNGQDANTAAGYISPTAAHTAGQYSSVNSNGYAITASGGAATNYSFTYVDGKLTITPRPITVTADSNQSKTYGQSDPTFTYQVGGQGLVNNDVLTGVLGRDSASQNAGSYNIIQNTITNINNPNYAITYIPAAFKINPAILNVAANSATKVYGTNDPALTYQATGFVTNSSLGINDTSTIMTGNLSRDSGENVGNNYFINQNTLSAGPNYTINYTGNKLNITPAQLIINANAASKTYGDEDPGLTYEAVGLVDNSGLGIHDSLASIGGKLVRETGENAGAYLINKGSLQNSNYNITYNGNTFTINKAPLTIKANDASRLYGDSNPAFSAMFSGFKNGDNSTAVTGLDFATAAGLSSNVGKYDIIPRNGVSQNYQLIYQNGQLTINPATLTYIADPYKRTVGEPNPNFLGTISGFKNSDTLASSTSGTMSFKSPATITSVPGTYAINGEGLTANYGNYIFEQAPSNATALTIVEAYHPVNPGGPGIPPGTGGGGSPVNIGFTGNGAVTVSLANESNDVGDLTPRKEGISLPVFTKDTNGVNAEGLYDVSYNQSSLTVIPTGQNVPPPPTVASSDSPYAPFDLKIGDGTFSFSVQELNGVVSITPMSDAARQALNKNDKNANKLILANGLLTAINELSVVPDQILAVVFVNN